VPEKIRIDSVEIRLVRLQVRGSFRASYGQRATSNRILVMVRAGDIEGWGECVAMEHPYYWPETVSSAWSTLVNILAPDCIGKVISDPKEEMLFPRVRGNQMAKHALESAIWDAWCRTNSIPLYSYIGGTTREVRAGISLGLYKTAGELCDEINKRLQEGYKWFKIKIEPGKDLDYVRRVRDEFPRLPLSVDANGAYTGDQIETLKHLDEFGLEMIEQPFAPTDLVDHRELAESLATPVCLDESVVDFESARSLIELHICDAINLKPGRVGGLRESLEIHRLCYSLGFPLWVGGMFETNIGRATSLALCTLPGITLPSDMSASTNYFERDVAYPNFEISDTGTLLLPEGPGTGVEIDKDYIKESTIKVQRLPD